jgi:DNA-directed RNA polymerase subunit alpha
MYDNTIILPSKPKIVSEEGFKGVYEIDGLYPGYGHTLGNSLRRIILSSLPGCAISSVKIDGVSHEFSTMKGVKEDVITILLNLKQVRIKLIGSDSQTLTLKFKGEGEVRAKDIKANGQVEIMNPDQIIATVTDKSADFSMEMVVERGIGFITKDEEKYVQNPTSSNPTCGGKQCGHWCIILGSFTSVASGTSGNFSTQNFYNGRSRCSF